MTESEALESSKMKIVITNTDDLRRAIVSGIDGALGSVFVRRFLSEDAVRVMRAQREYWMNDQGTELSKLLEILRREP